MTTLTATTQSMGSIAPPAAPPPRPPAPASTSGLSGGDVIRIIRSRMIMIILLTLLFFSIGTGVTLIFYFWYPSYSGTSYIRVQSVSPINVMNPLERQRVEAEEVQRLLQDQALLVKSPQVINAALEDNDLRATKWFQWAQEKEKNRNEDPADLLADIVSAAPVRDSNYVGVSATWREAKEVPVLVNTVVEKYVEKINTLQREGIRAMEGNLGKELNNAKIAYENKQREIAEYRAQQEILDKPSDDKDNEVATIRALSTELTMDLDGKKALYEALQNARPEDLPITPALQSVLSQDPQIYQADQKLQQEDETISALEARFGPNHRTVKEARIRRDLASEKAQQERSSKILKYQSEQIEQARRDFLEAQEQLLKVRERLMTSEQEQRERDLKYWNYKKMMDDGEQLKKQYEQLLEQHNQLTITLRLDKSVQIDVRSKAVQPRRRSQPKLEIWLPIAGVLGLAMAVGIAMLLELTDSSVRTPRDIARQSMPVLGTIPVTDDDEIEIERVETASLDAPHSIVAEAFRNLRTNLFFSAPAEQQASILITSPSGGNGKTTVAVNLAIAIALSGRRVLLVDANFRRSGLPRIFPGIPTEGLSNLLIGSGHLEDYVTTTSVPGLDVLGAGPIPPNPAELLGSSYLRDLLADARGRYDQVIFDGPPLLLVSDAMVLAASVDGVVMVCQYRSTSRGALQRCQSQLASMGARVFGAVLNRIETRAGGYFRKSYREFYEYHEAEELEEGQVARPRLDTSSGAIQANEEGGGGTAVAESETATALESQSLLDHESSEATASADTGGIAGSGEVVEWSSGDIDREINKLNAEDALGTPEDYKIADDLNLEDDLGDKKP
ncbi:MAG TPA: polysaccharide biosynthesis tyrosine autokinase [Phycisphaerae bacterium]|nr:polysaccharide biosynthesis tyrosine autokinase [Phycisphaerae bacterium]